MVTILGQGLSAVPMDSGVSSGTAWKHDCKKNTINNTKNYKELHMGSMEPLHIFALVCFGPLSYIQVELGWESNFL